VNTRREFLRAAATALMAAASLDGLLRLAGQVLGQVRRQVTVVGQRVRAPHDGWYLPSRSSRVAMFACDVMNNLAPTRPLPA
jgi:hypothetical protein